MNEAVLLGRLRAAFKAEAEERLASLSSGLLDLEKGLAPEEVDGVLEVIFREAHSLKGASRAVNLSTVETLCQSMEGLFGALKRNEVPLSPALFDTLHESVGAVEAIVAAGEDGDPPDLASGSIELIERLERLRTRVPLTEQFGVTSVQAPEAPQVPAEKEPPSEEAAASPAPQPAPERTPESPREEEMPEVGAAGTNPDPDPGPSGGGASVAATPDRTPSVTPAPPAQTVLPAPPAQTANAAHAARAVKPEAQAEQAVKPLAPQSRTVRISSDKLDSLLLKAEELVSLKPMAAENLEFLRSASRSIVSWKERWHKIDDAARETRRAATVRGDRLAEGGLRSSLTAIADFADRTREHFQSLEEDLRKAITAASEHRYSLSRMVDDLLDDMKMVTMLPFASLFELLPKMVREISRTLRKEVCFELRGSETEIDKRILEEIKDPLIHLLRNAVDHGIESPAERKRTGKSRTGSIALTVAQIEGSKVEIAITDDGGGIDLEKVRVEAVDRGILSRSEADNLGGSELTALVLRSGLSTSDSVTEISGRGLGLAIVQEKIEKLGGDLTIESEPGSGTTFRMRLPVTMATFRGILVRVGEGEFVIPSTQVNRVLHVETAAVRNVEGGETIPVDGRVLPLVEISHVLGVRGTDRETAEGGGMTVVVLGTGDQRFAFRVDDVVNEQEVLVKSLGPQLERVRNVAGATVMGSGRPVLILNVNDLVLSATRSPRAAAPPAMAGDGDDDRAKSILVAEDSITSRMLLKNILESAGYTVTTTVDGLDAYTTLQAGEFDLVVSDVEMPRMSGFDLTSRIRTTSRFAETPVVLVTALKSQADRERGFDAGASAYIVKGSFDQSNLLDTVRRLL